MNKVVKTIASKGFVSLLLTTDDQYTCCVIPRYDAYLLSQAIKESIDNSYSVSFETSTMHIDILNMNNSIIIDCTFTESGNSFQISYTDIKDVGDAIEKATIKAVDQFGKATEKRSKWAIFKTISDPV
ncbi:MAG: hypothetical protein ACTSU7_01435 [Candidatus Heimdallarchaeaceae archaeon]